MTTSLTAIKPLLNELKRDLQELYGDRLVKLILFGSHARGEANLDSDIDLLAVLKSPVSQVQEIFNMSNLLVKMLLEHDELVSIIPMSEERFNAKDVALLRNIHREGIELWTDLESCFPSKGNSWIALTRNFRIALSYDSRTLTSSTIKESASIASTITVVVIKSASLMMGRRFLVRFIISRHWLMPEIASL